MGEVEGEVYKNSLYYHYNFYINLEIIPKWKCYLLKGGKGALSYQEKTVQNPYVTINVA